jgi:catalase (peroxidase I)
MGGKGFGGGEATRDPMPTAYDLNDPKGKQGAIHKAESFSDYLARRDGGTAEAAVCPHAAAAAAPSLAYVPLASAAATNRDYLGNAPIQGARSTAVAPQAVGAAHSVGRSGAVDYAAVRRELTLLMDNPSWDDGSLAPVFIRLAWHSSGTYDKASNTGGSNGAGMRYETEAADPENAGLEVARAFLEPVKRRFPGISYSDLWILAAYVGIEYTGGPAIEFTPGVTLTLP